VLFAPYNVAEMTDLQSEGIVCFDRQALTVDRIPPASLVLAVPEIQCEYDPDHLPRVSVNNNRQAGHTRSDHQEVAIDLSRLGNRGHHGGSLL
jgi:hypothetical protein